jgi:hypothetical protein
VAGLRTRTPARVLSAGSSKPAPARVADGVRDIDTGTGGLPENPGRTRTEPGNARSPGSGVLPGDGSGPGATSPAADFVADRSGDGQLPFTGLAVLALLGLGAALAASGLGLRRATRIA